MRLLNTVTSNYEYKPKLRLGYDSRKVQTACSIQLGVRRTYALLRTSVAHDTMAKRALFVGCNYPGSPHQLAGCANDANSMRSLLCEVFNYQVQNVVMMVDSDAQTTAPTGVNIKVGQDLTTLLSCRVSTTLTESLPIYVHGISRTR